MALPALAGWTVGITADRRWEEQAELLQRRGAAVVHGASVRTLPLDLDEGLRRATDAIIAAPPDVVVLNTAVGTRAWIGAAESVGLDEPLLAALRRATVIVRGPKAAGAAVTVGLDVAWRAESERSSEIVERLQADGVAGSRIAVQRDGAPTPSMADALATAGADVIDVPVYRWELPTDEDPAVRLAEAVVDGRIDAVSFTSTPGLEGFVNVANRAGLGSEVRRALNGPVVALCVGPVCAESAVRNGLLDPVQPKRGRLGAMVQALAREAGVRRREFQVGPLHVTQQAALVAVGDRQVELPVRERRILAALADRPGAVVAKADLLRRVWDDRDVDAHALEVAAGRLRKRVAEVGLAVDAVPRRGYRLTPA